MFDAYQAVGILVTRTTMTPGAARPMARDTERSPVVLNPVGRRSSVVSTLTPFHAASRPRRFAKIALWIAAIVLALVVLRVLGVDVIGWIEHLWQQPRHVPIGYIVAAAILQIAQTTLSGLAYYGILAYAYPGARGAFWSILTAFAVGVAMNNFFQASLGTVVTLLMFLAIIPGATFAGAVGASVVSQIFFTIAAGLVYIYLFVELGAAFNVNLGWLRHHPVLILAIVIGCAALVLVGARVLWTKVRSVWKQAKHGGKILESPSKFTTRVLVPQALSYAAKIGLVCVLLAAYSIPVSVHSVFGVIGSSSAANDCAHAGSGRGDAGCQRRRARWLHECLDGRGLFAHPAIPGDGGELLLRAGIGRDRLRLEGRKGTCLRGVRRGED